MHRPTIYTVTTVCTFKDKAPKRRDKFSGSMDDNISKRLTWPPKSGSNLQNTSALPIPLHSLTPAIPVLRPTRPSFVLLPTNTIVPCILTVFCSFIEGV